MIKVISVLMFFVSYISADESVIKSIFEKYKVEGSFVLSTLKSDELFIYNETRADRRFPVASTFKIPHTLIALNEGIINSESDIIKWDGVKRGYEPWNKNQTLQSALAISCVWCYKQFSQKISKKKYLEYLSKFNYGNKAVGEDKSSFWLDGALKISSYEQIDFLKKVYLEILPISQENLAILKNIMRVEVTPNYEIKAKSGWDGSIGWYVGYVTTAKDVYFFAFNADIKREQLKLRQEIVYAVLRAKKIIE